MDVVKIAAKLVAKMVGIERRVVIYVWWGDLRRVDSRKAAEAAFLHGQLLGHNTIHLFQRCALVVSQLVRGYYVGRI